MAAPNPQIIERTNNLIEICREAGASPAVQGIESFVVFFQALVPTLSPEGAGNIRRFFFRLAPTLIHIAYNDFGSRPSDREDGLAALRNLESILIEISSVRLAPSESELVFKSVDQMSEFIAVGEYAMANDTDRPPARSASSSATSSRGPSTASWRSRSPSRCI